MGGGRGQRRLDGHWLAIGGIDFYKSLHQRLTSEKATYYIQDDLKKQIVHTTKSWLD